MFVFDETQSRQLYIVIRLTLDYVIASAKLPHDDGMASIDEASGVLDALQAIGLIDSSSMTGKYFEPQKLVACIESK